VVAAVRRIHVEPVRGARTMASTAPSEVQDQVAELTRPRSAAVVIRAFGVPSGVLDRAVNDMQLGCNPARGLALPNVEAVKRMLGHASAAMSLDTYADLFEDDLSAVAGAFDRARTAAVAVDMQSRASSAWSRRRARSTELSGKRRSCRGGPGGTRTRHSSPE
jgi:hypothetical protein